MIILFQVDKSGRDFFEKDYSIVLVVNQKKIYGINIPQKLKDDLNYQFKNNLLNIRANSEKTRKNRFRLRFHTAVIIKLVEKALNDIKRIDEINFQICNDFDGHFHEIKDMIYKNLKRNISVLKLENIIQVKFPKPSKIDEAGKSFRNNDGYKLKNYISVRLNSDELISLIKK